MSTVQISPFWTPELFDSYTLGGARAPGVVKLSGHDRVEDWDSKQAKGNKGANATHTGSSPIEFSAEHYLVIDPVEGVDQEAEWDEFAKIIESTVSGATPIAVDIFHPDLARNGIKSVVKKSLGGFVRDGLGGVTVTVRFLEYRPPQPKAVSGAKGAGGGASTGNKAVDAIINSTKKAFDNVADWFG